ncbi:MAG: PepSY-associated TM helix domain-containing protein [Meiothermus silvanus]|nr:PepSY-associated TM helix domain-containing protein [Allomeiothermus silvanus]
MQSLWTGLSALRASMRWLDRVANNVANSDTPGYAADAFIRRVDGSYTVKVVAQGPVAVLNDLHRGRDAGQAWAWLIDLSGGFLLLVSLTGFGLALFFRKTRQAAVLTALFGTLLLLAMAWLAR